MVILFPVSPEARRISVLVIGARNRAQLPLEANHPSSSVTGHSPSIHPYYIRRTMLVLSKGDREHVRPRGSDPEDRESQRPGADPGTSGETAGVTESRR